MIKAHSIIITQISDEIALFFSFSLGFFILCIRLHLLFLLYSLFISLMNLAVFGSCFLCPLHFSDYLPIHQLYYPLAVIHQIDIMGDEHNSLSFLMKAAEDLHYAFSCSAVKVSCRLVSKYHIRI